VQVLEKGDYLMKNDIEKGRPVEVIRQASNLRRTI
jgi:hypothetical protein